MLACAVGVVLARRAGVTTGTDGSAAHALPAVLRTALVGVAFFGLCGYAPAWAIARGELAAHRVLLVLPLGAAVSSLSLALLGLLHVPLAGGLAIVIVASLAASAITFARSRGAPRRGARPPARIVLARIVLPALLAAVVALISLLPIMRAGYATVVGQNGDAVLAVGSAVLLEHAPPTATRTDLPINHVPLQWRSKYPIYYALAGISTLAGQDPIRTFATVSALMLALTSFGLFLFARYALRAPPWVALVCAFLVPLDRIVMYVTIHPFYNELWGQFTLPFVLLFGWRYLHSPDRRGAVAFALFLALGLLAYPLMIPFPATFLLPYAWVVYRRRHAAGESTRWIAALRLPRPRSRPWLWLPVAVVAVPVAAVLVRGFLEKTVSALQVLAPWTNLAGWHGTALPYLPWPPFVGMPGHGWLDFVGFAAVCVLAIWGLTRVPEGTRLALGGMVAATALIGVYFRVRGLGELFFFKDLAFLGPYVLMLALIGLGALAAARMRVVAALGATGLALAAVVVPTGAAREVDATYPYANPSVLGLRAWDHALPAETSLRIDVPLGGYQLWCTYMFSDHRLSATDPLGGFFPHPPRGRKADYVIAQTDQPRPADAFGAPVFQNMQFRLWRMNPAVPGPDISTRHLVDDISNITIG